MLLTGEEESPRNSMASTYRPLVSLVADVAASTLAVLYIFAFLCTPL